MSRVDQYLLEGLLREASAFDWVLEEGVLSTCGFRRYHSPVERIKQSSWKRDPGASSVYKLRGKEFPLSPVSGPIKCDAGATEF